MSVERLATVSYLPGFTPAPSGREGEDRVSPAPAADPGDESRAEELSMRALTRRGMSRHELRESLLSHGLDAGAVEFELDRLERVGLLDDIALAETVVRTQHERKGLSRGALAVQLRRRGIDHNVIIEALDGLDATDEQRKAVELAVKRAGQLLRLDRETAARRLTGFLLRRGYTSSTVRVAVEAALPRSSNGVHFS